MLKTWVVPFAIKLVALTVLKNVVDPELVSVRSPRGLVPPTAPLKARLLALPVKF